MNGIKNDYDTALSSGAKPGTWRSWRMVGYGH